MKKIIFFLAAFIWVTGCDSTSRAVSKRAIDWPKYDTIPFKTVERLAKQYYALRSADFTLNVREINLSAQVLREIAEESTELKLIMGADTKNNIVIVVERRDLLKKKTWYYLNDLFKDGQPGSDWLPPLCSLEPALCSPILRTPSANSEISLPTARSMSERYYGQSKTDPSKIILQMNLDPAIIKGLIGSYKNVKLISAIDKARGDSNTLILEFMNGSQITYLDLKSRTSNPVCPPPPGCTLSEN